MRLVALVDSDRDHRTNAEQSGTMVHHVDDGTNLGEGGRMNGSWRVEYYNGHSGTRDGLNQDLQIRELHKHDSHDRRRPVTIYNGPYFYRS